MHVFIKTNIYSKYERRSDIREQLDIFEINDKLTQYKINWGEHIKRMDDNKYFKSQT